MAIELDIDKPIKTIINNKRVGLELESVNDRDLYEQLFHALEVVKEGISEKLGTSGDIEIHSPKFFVKRSISEDQRKVIDEIVGPIYAKESVKLQKVVMTVPIAESMEKFTSIREVFAKEDLRATYSELPFSSACGEWAGKPRLFWARESVVSRLLIVGKVLSDIGIEMHFEDSFRPVGVQEGLFRRRVDWIFRDHADWDKDKILEEAMSKTAITPRLASHKSGAAVDVTFRLPSGEPMDLGNKYPEGGALVALDCPFVTKKQWITRQIFKNTFSMAGFALYPGEDWHVSLNDNLAGVKNNKMTQGYSALYGPIKDFDIVTGKVNSIYNKEELDIPFY